MPTNQGLRMQVGRLSRAVPIEEIAEAINIDPDTLMEYETAEEIEIPPEVLWNASDYLDIELSFFLRQLPLISVYPISDALDRMPQNERDVVVSQAIFWLEHYLDLEAYVPLEEIPIGRFPEGFPLEVETPKEAVLAAKKLRRAWDLGLTTPITEFSAMLSRHGFKVGTISGIGSFDSVAMLSVGDIPLPIILTRVGLVGDLQRFTMARALGYFMMKNPTRQMASHFAGSFLMPAEVLQKEIGHSRQQIELSELYFLKSRYGMSMRFLLTRIASLRLIPREVYEFWIQRFRDEAWILAEPGGEYAPESPTYMLQTASRFVSEGDLSKQDAAEILQVSEDVWSSMLSLGQEFSEAELDAYFDALENT